MNAVELLKYALGNAFGILDQVVADVDQEQADWMPPGVANPIGALYWHTVSSVDVAVHDSVRGRPPLSQSAGWYEKVVIASAPEEEEDPVAQMQAIRVDLVALHDYAQATAQAVQDWLASLTPEDLERAIDTPVGELNLGQMLELFVIWHINAHCGEIAALKGCQGAKGYPW
jgi:hypothetical protein